MNSSDKKTICIVLGGHFSAETGGAQFQANCIIEHLKESNKYKIYYLARMVNPNFKPDGYEIVQIAEPVGIRKYGFAFDTIRLLNLLRGLKPDVIYQRGLTAYTGVIAYYAKKAGCRSVFHIASDYNLLPLHMKERARMRIRWLRLLDKRMGEYGIRNVDKVIAQTKFQADLLERNYGRRVNAVIPNFQPFPNEELIKSSHEVRVIWIANFKPLKQPEIFVQLASDLAYRNNLRFVMIGHSGSPAKFAELHAEMGRMANLTYMGELPIEEVNRQLAASHIFVNTSRAEGFPNTFIQAWMRKVPTLSLVVNPDDVLSSEKIGYCGKTYEMLRDKVLELADNRELRERIGAAGQQYAFKVHSPKVAERLIAILDGSGDD